MKTAPKASYGNQKAKQTKRRAVSSDSESNSSYGSESDSESESESSFSDDSDSDDYRGKRRGKQSAPQVRASGRLKEMKGASKYRDESSGEDYSSSEQASPPRKWQPPKGRAPPPKPSSAPGRKKQVSESEDVSEYESDFSSATSEPQDSETDVEEATDLIVDKIIAKRKSGDSWQYLVKWRCRSYIHCEWVAGKDLSFDIGSDKRSVKLKNFNQKHHGETVPSFEKGYFYNPQHELVEKILAVRKAPDSPETVQYLIKWSGLPYGESTWEVKSDLDNNPDMFELALAEFHKLNEKKRCDVRFRTNSKESYGRVMGRQFDPTADFALCLTAVASRVEPKPDAGPGPMEYEYVPAGRSLVPENEPPFRIFDFQKEGISWLLYNWSQARGCILADEMGLGKTVQTAVTLAQMSSHCKTRGGGELTHLIIAPLSTIEQWRREIKKWTDLEPVVYHGNRRDRNVIHKYEWDGRVHEEDSLSGNPGTVTFDYRKSPSFMPKFDVLITTFETISGEPEVFNAPDFVWSAIVIDEAHKLKSSDGKARNSVIQIPCRHRILLTGTPIQNNVGELWNLLHLCAPSVWDDQAEFLSEFGSLNSAELTQKLQNKIQPFLLQRRKADVLAHLMPAKEETIVSVELTRLQKETYRAVYEKNLAVLSGPKKTVPSLTNVHMELRKCCNHPFLVAGVEERVTHELEDYSRIMEYLINASGKMVFLDKLLGKLHKEGSKILIFSQFTMMLDLIEDYLRWRGYVFERLDGAIKGQQRQEAVDRFNRTPEDPASGGSFVFLLSTKAGGVGLNLTAANYVLLFDHDWNPQNDLQAQARCHRIGQTREVMIFRLVTRGTYEEKMFQVASQKLGLEQAVMSGDAKGGPKLSKEELDRLLKEGAYAMLEDDENEQKFCAENVDEILKTRARTVSTFVEGGGAMGGGFSKARFQVNEDDDVDINDPNFWTKMAAVGQLNTAPKQTEEDNMYLDYAQRRGRAQFGVKKPTHGLSSVSSMDEEDESEFEETTKKKATGPKRVDKTEENRLKRMKNIVKFVLSYGLVENKALFDARFGNDSDPDLEPMFPAYADHLLLIVSMYLMAKSSSTMSRFDEIHLCPTVRAAVGLLAQFRATQESPPPSIEPLMLDGMMPDLLHSIERLDVSVPSSLVGTPLPRFVTEAVPKNRNAKKLVLEVDAMNEIRFHVKTGGALLKRTDKPIVEQWTKEMDVELLKLVLEHGLEGNAFVGPAIAMFEKFNQHGNSPSGNEKFNQGTNSPPGKEKFNQQGNSASVGFPSQGELTAWISGRVDRILPKLTLVRSFQLFLVVCSFGYHPALLDRVLKATGYPWVRKFACGDSLVDMLKDSDIVATLLTQVVDIPTPAMEITDEMSFYRFILQQLPSDSPLSTLDVSDYAKSLLYRTVSCLGKKSDKHDNQVRSLCKSSKTNDYLFDSTAGSITALYPQRSVSRMEAFKQMWRFQTLHFVKQREIEDKTSAIGTFSLIARAVGLDRWEAVTNVNRHIRPNQCLESLMKHTCLSLMVEPSEPATTTTAKRKTPDQLSAEDEPGSAKMTKLTDFFSKKEEQEAKPEVLE